MTKPSSSSHSDEDSQTASEKSWTHEDYDVFNGNPELARAEDLNDFIWVLHDEPHASRRKEFLKKHPEVKELMGHEPMTKYIVTAMIAVQVSLAIYLGDEIWEGGSVTYWLTAYIVGGTISQALFLAAHEISHNLAFKKFSHNKMFGIFTNMPLLVPFFMYFKFYHNEHHKYQGVDGIDTDLPTEIETKLFSSYLGKLFFMTFQIWFYAIRPVLVKKPVITWWHALNYAVQFAFIGSLYYFFGLGPLIYLLVSVHFSGSLHPMAAHFIAEHYVFAQEAETYSYYGPLNLFTWNVGYHNEHHDFPTVPWSRLPALYKLGEKDFYGNLPYHSSWTRVMWEFLNSPHISLKNRVKRQDKKTREKNTDADYTGAWLNGTGLSADDKTLKTE